MNRPTGPRLIVELLWLILVCGAAGPGAARAQQIPPEAGPSPKQELRAAEIAFARTVAVRDRAAFLALVAEDAVFLSPAPLVGQAAIEKAWAPFFVADGPVLEWKPEIVELQPGGTLGITQGPYQLTIRGEDGTPQVRKGTFTSIWRREEGGGWRIIFDSGCPCQPGD